MEAQQIDVRPQESPDRICPFCRDALRADEPDVACPGCDTRHHRACWGEGSGCATCRRGAQGIAVSRRGARTIVHVGDQVPVAEAPPLRRWLVALGVVGLTAVLLVPLGLVGIEAGERAEAARPPSTFVPFRSGPAPPPPDLRSHVLVGQRFTFRMKQWNEQPRTEVWTVTAVTATDVTYSVAREMSPRDREELWLWESSVQDVPDGEEPGPATLLDVGGVRVPCRPEATTEGVEWVRLAPGGRTSTFPGPIKTTRRGVIERELLKIE
jgi:hypothetical protein